MPASRPTDAKLAATARMIDEAAERLGATVEWVHDEQHIYAMLMRDEVEVAVECLPYGAVLRSGVHTSLASLTEAASDYLIAKRKQALEAAASWTESLEQEEAARAVVRERLRACGQALLSLVKKDEVSHG